jgi:hypothetical protein
MDDNTAAEKAERLGEEAKVFVVVAEGRDGTIWGPVKEAVLAREILRNIILASASVEPIVTWRQAKKAYPRLAVEGLFRVAGNRVRLAKRAQVTAGGGAIAIRSDGIGVDMVEAESQISRPPYKPVQRRRYTY